MATNRDLLKEAIADAKAVKEMAIANAKTALEEAFTPRLKEMLSAKIQEMDKEDDDVKEMEYEEDDSKDSMEEMMYDEDESKDSMEEMEYEEDDSKKSMEEMEYEEDDSKKSMEEEMDEEMNLEELLAELEEEEKVEEGKKSDDKEDVQEGMYEEDDDDMDDDDMDGEGEPLDLEDMTDEDLKKMIEDVISDMVASGELEGGDVEDEEESEEMEMSDEEEDVDLTELLKEIEEEMLTEEDTIFDGNEKEVEAAAKKFAAAVKSGKISPEDLPSKDEVEAVVTDSDIAKIKKNLEEALMLHEGDEDGLKESKEIAQDLIDSEMKQLARNKKVARIAKILGISLLAAAAIVGIAFLPQVVAAANAASVLAPGVMTAAGKVVAGAAAAAGIGTATAIGGAKKEFDTKQKERDLQRKQKALEEELYEAKAEIESLKSDLNEAVKETNATNLLNAKLLYTNKIFKAKNLNENQKVKVLSSFDKANTTKEAKLVYETLSEGLKTKKSTIKENLGRASKATTIPTTKKPIVESNEVFARMQKLAGIIK